MPVTNIITERDIIASNDGSDLFPDNTISTVNTSTSENVVSASNDGSDLFLNQRDSYVDSIPELLSGLDDRSGAVDKWATVRTEVSGVERDDTNVLAESIMDADGVFTKALIMTSPTAYSDGRLHSIKPDISADFDFTRGSSATRVNEAGLIESVAANLPRINYENGIGHLLLEPQRTNLVTYSEDFSNAYWSKTSSTVTTSTVISPDGLQGSYKLIPDNGTGGNRSVWRDYSSLTGLHTHTCFAKKGEYDYVMLRTRNSPSTGVMFDLANGTLSVNQTSAAYVSSKIENYGNGWYRCSITLDPSQAGTVGQLKISMSVGITGSEDTVFSGDGTSGVYIWGAQFEEGSYGTSYIVSNSGSATTRLAETCNNAGNSDIIPSDEGVLYAEIAAFADDLTQRHISISDGSDSDVVRINYHISSNSIRGQVRAGGFILASITHIVPDIKDFHKVAIRYKENDVKLYVDGVLVSTATSASMPTGLGKLAFDNGNSVSPFYGKTRMVAVFPYLSDDELIKLTR